MNFEVDNQTIKDLNLYYNDENSILQFLNYTNTNQGELYLIEKLRKPTSDVNQINERIETIEYICKHNIDFALLQKDLEFVEHYINLEFKISKDTFIDSIKDKIKSNYVNQNNYYLIDRGITSLIQLLNRLKQAVKSFEDKKAPILLKTMFSEISNIIENKTITNSLKLNSESINYRQRNRLDKAFRYTHKDAIDRLLNLIYEWDVLNSLKLAINKNNYSLPTLLSINNGPILKIKDLFHPLIPSPVKNDLKLNATSNLCFLTGANMSGKSTLLKAIGIAVYLAHLGFPVPASNMTITPFKGIITSINLSDNINLGYSHYFSEVKRIKYISDQLEVNKHILVIMDEMFRGTNVEEAHYGTHTISSAFANISSSIFFISSHIIEVAEILSKNENISLKHMDNVTNIHESDFKLKSGISNKKLGRKILEDQGVIESLKNLNNRV